MEARPIATAAMVGLLRRIVVRQPRKRDSAWLTMVLAEIGDKNNPRSANEENPLAGDQDHELLEEKECFLSSSRRKAARFCGKKEKFRS